MTPVKFAKYVCHSIKEEEKYRLMGDSMDEVEENSVTVDTDSEMHLNPDRSESLNCDTRGKRCNAVTSQNLAVSLHCWNDLIMCAGLRSDHCCKSS
jgi:hypothetical protein